MTFVLANLRCFSEIKGCGLILLFLSITLGELFTYMSYCKAKVIKLVDIASLFSDVQIWYSVSLA